MGLNSEEKEVCPWQCHHGQQEKSPQGLSPHRVGIAELSMLLCDARHYSLKISVPKVMRQGTGKTQTLLCQLFPSRLAESNPLCSQICAVSVSSSQMGKITFSKGKSLQTWKLWEEEADQNKWHGEVSDQNSLNYTYEVSKSWGKKNTWMTYNKFFI